MWSPRHVLVTLFLCLLAGSLLMGCRAFEPETIIVNRAPETYLIGSPAEESGGYFHFHVFWYGTDEDGYVERFVWALTDTSIQDPDTDDDEEDLNFNPFSNITTLEIGTYTTRTDTVFDFQINQGAVLSYDMTLHMVAQDDRGLFDRTPARLWFFSNALGNPQVEFYRSEIAEANRFADYDTVAFGDPLFLKWAGVTPNITAYNPELLAIRDTVPLPPLPEGIEPDGLLGFQWTIPEENIPWNPRAFDEALGDSFSYFGDVTELTFLNDGSGNGIFSRQLNAGTYELMVNTIDVAGVQVPVPNQAMHFVVNYDPDTEILRGEPGPPEFNDPTVYPYYIVFWGDEAGQYTFADGDTVPDRAHVVFKALGWDDLRDNQQSAENLLTFQGRFIAGQNIRVDGIFYTFDTSYSDPHQTPEWTAPVATDPSADTLRFEVGPFDYEVVMRSVDENLTRDGTPDTFRFVGNYPPCVQCIEIGNIDYDPVYVYDDPCYNTTCLDETPVLQVYKTDFPPDPRYDSANPLHLQVLPGGDRIWLRVNSGQITFDTPANPDSWEWVPAIHYSYLVFLEGKDHEREHWQEDSEANRSDNRISAWQYQIDYELDVTNAIADGGGSDNIGFLSGFNVGSNLPDPNLSDLYILKETNGVPSMPTDGTWALRVTVGVPQFLMLFGRDSYWSFLRGSYFASDYPEGGTTEEILAWQAETETQQAYRAWQMTTMQFSPGSVAAIAADGSTCDWRNNTNSYHYYDGTRIPHPNGRSCDDGDYDNPDQGISERGNIDLEDFIAYSNNRIPTAKDFDLQLYLPNDPDPFAPGEDPPNWLTPPGGRNVSWR